MTSVNVCLLIIKRAVERVTASTPEEVKSTQKAYDQHLLWCGSCYDFVERLYEKTSGR